MAGAGRNSTTGSGFFHKTSFDQSPKAFPRELSQNLVYREDLRNFNEEKRAPYSKAT
jgi:hypothetical protein